MHIMPTPTSFLIVRLATLGMGILFGLSACDTPRVPGNPTPSATSTRPASTPTRTPTATLAPSPTPLVLGVEPGDLKGRRILFWHTWTGELEPVINQLEAEFNATNPWGIWVDAENVAGRGDISESLQSALETGDLPDVVLADAEDAAAWNETQTLLVDLAPLVQSEAWGMTPEQVSDIPAIYWDQDLAGGQRLGVPVLRTARVLFYNQTWAEELGFASEPATLEAFQDQVCAAAQANLNDFPWENDGTGGWIIDDDPLTVSAWILALGDGSILTADIQPDYASVGSAFSSLRELFDRGCIWQARLQDPISYFTTRQALVFSGTLEDIPTVAYALRQAGVSDDWRVLPYPPAEGEPVFLVEGPSLHVLVSEPAKEVAGWLFSRFLISPASQSALAAANVSLPINQAALTEMQTGGNMPRAWIDSLDWLDQAQPAPNQSDWRLIRRVLADAHHQLYQANTQPKDIPQILDLIRDTLEELRERQP